MVLILYEYRYDAEDDTECWQVGTYTSWERAQAAKAYAEKQCPMNRYVIEVDTNVDKMPSDLYGYEED